MYYYLCMLYYIYIYKATSTCVALYFEIKMRLFIAFSAVMTLH